MHLRLEVCYCFTLKYRLVIYLHLQLGWYVYLLTSDLLLSSTIHQSRDEYSYMVYGLVFNIAVCG